MPEPHPWPPNSASPASTAGRRRLEPGCPAARPPATPATRSPDGSAAASSSSRRVCSGRASSCRGKLSSIRPVSGAAPGSPNPPASSAGLSPRGSSSSASGLPLRLGHDQVADPRVQRPGQRRVQQRPRITLGQPVDVQLGQPGQLRARIAGREHQADRVGAPAAAPRTPAPAPRPGPATARHRSRRSAGVPRPPPTAGSAPPARPGTGPAAAPRRGRTRSAARPAAAPAAAPRGPASARTAGAARRTPAPSPTARPPARTTRHPAACPARYSSSAVLPMPGSPRTTSARLSPARTAATSWSSASRSRCRFISPVVRPCTAGFVLNGPVLRVRGRLTGHGHSHSLPTGHQPRPAQSCTTKSVKA